MVASSVAAGGGRRHSVVLRGARQGLRLAGRRHCQSRRSRGNILFVCIVGVSDEVDHGAGVIASALLLAHVILVEYIPNPSSKAEPQFGFFLTNICPHLRTCLVAKQRFFKTGK